MSGGREAKKAPMNKGGSNEFPQRPRTHVLGEEGVRSVTGCFPREWFWRVDSPDYGVDLVVSIVKGTDVTGTQFAVQVKGSDIKVDDSAVTARIKRNTVNFWRNRPERVMLAIYSSDLDSVFWKWVGLGKVTDAETISVRIPRSQQLSAVDWSLFVSDLEDYYARRARADLEGIKGSLMSAKLASIGSLSGQLRGHQGTVDHECGVDVYEDSCVVHFAGSQCGIIDCGMQSRSQIMQWFESRHIDHLSFLAVSHLHLDHFGGLSAIMSRIATIDVLLIPPMALVHAAIYRQSRRDEPSGSFGAISSLLKEIRRFQDGGTRVVQLSQTADSLKLGTSDSGEEIRLDVFVPINNLQRLINSISSGMPYDPNSACAVFAIRFGLTSFLIPGDVNLSAWSELIQAHSEMPLASDGLVMPHNGSISSISPDILKRLVKGPGFSAIIQPLLRYGLPKDQVLDWVRQQGGSIVRVGARPAHVRFRSTGIELH